MSERKVLELSKEEVHALIIAELHRRFPRALPLSIDFESRTARAVDPVIAARVFGYPEPKADAAHRKEKGE